MAFSQSANIADHTVGTKEHDRLIERALELAATYVVLINERLRNGEEPLDVAAFLRDNRPVNWTEGFQDLFYRTLNNLEYVWRKYESTTLENKKVNIYYQFPIDCSDKFKLAVWLANHKETYETIPNSNL